MSETEMIIPWMLDEQIVSYFSTTQFNIYIFRSHGTAFECFAFALQVSPAGIFESENIAHRFNGDGRHFTSSAPSSSIHN